jgi:hypothetical protein
MEEFFLEDEPKEIATRQAEGICGEEEIKNIAEIFKGAPELIGSDFPSDFVGIVKKALHHYSILPSINYEEVHSELASLTVKTQPTPTLQLISQELQKVQALKERAAEIIKNIIPVHTMKKRHVEILKEAWVHFSKEKSADKRKADATYRISEFESDYLAIDALMKTANHIIKNLDSIQEILSRRITVISLEVKISELGRNSVVDYDFSGPSLNDSDNASAEVVEESFGGEKLDESVFST